MSYTPNIPENSDINQRIGETMPFRSLSYVSYTPDIPENSDINQRIGETEKWPVNGERS